MNEETPQQPSIEGPPYAILAFVIVAVFGFFAYATKRETQPPTSQAPCICSCSFQGQPPVVVAPVPTSP